MVKTRNYGGIKTTNPFDKFKSTTSSFVCLTFQNLRNINELIYPHHKRDTYSGKCVCNKEILQ